jgi:uncharacterized protein YggE
MRAFIFVLTLATVCCVRCAESGLKATVPAMASVDVVPTSFDVILTIKRKGPDARTAAAALKTARETALGKLAGLGAKLDLAHSDNPVVVEKAAPNAQMLAMQQQQGVNRLKRKDAKDDAPPEVQMKQVVRVPFVLAGKDRDGITIEAENFKAAVRAANLFPEAPFGAEDDAVGEEQPDMNAYYPGMPKKRGAIAFEFSAPRTSELEQQAYKAALKIARERAAGLAEAAGFRTAELTSVTLQSMDSSQLEAMNPYYAAMAANDSSAQLPDTLGAETPALTLRVTLLVECQLK